MIFLGHNTQRKHAKNISMPHGVLMAPDLWQVVRVWKCNRHYVMERKKKRNKESRKQCPWYVANMKEIENCGNGVHKDETVQRKIVKDGFTYVFKKMLTNSIQEKLDSGRLNSGRLDAWTLDAWTLGLWNPGHLDSGCLDSGRSNSGPLDTWTLDAWTLDAWTLDAWAFGL